jgi:hypothetical protein
VLGATDKADCVSLWKFDDAENSCSWFFCFCLFRNCQDAFSTNACFWRLKRVKELHMGILDDLLGNEQLQKQYKDFVKRYEQGDPSEG